MDVRRRTNGTLLVGGPYCGTRVLSGVLELRLADPEPGVRNAVALDPHYWIGEFTWHIYERVPVEIRVAGYRFFFTVFAKFNGPVVTRALLLRHVLAHRN